MTKAGLILKAIVSDIDAIHQQYAAASPIDRILQKISKLDLHERGLIESYLRHKWRM